jgi:hypothetical protein
VGVSTLRRALGLLIAALLLARPVTAQGPVTIRNSAGAEVGTQSNPLMIQDASPLSVYELNGQQTAILTAVTGNTSADITAIPGRLILTVNCSSCAGGTTVSWYGSSDQVNYFPLAARQIGIALPVSSITYATSTTTAGLTYWETSSPGYNLRATVTSYSSGTITVTAQYVSLKSDNVYVANGTAATPLQVSLANTGANGTAVAISAASLPLPSTAATSTKQSDGSQKTQIVDGSGNVIGATTNALDVNIKSGNPTTMTVTQGTGTNLHIVCDSGCSSSAGFADNGAFTFGTTAVNPMAGVFDDVASNTATENSAAIARITANKALHVNFRNASGTEIGTSSNPIQVTLANTGANTSKLLVTPDSVALPANQSVNVNQLAGTTTDTNSGTKSAGTLRVVLATDQPQLTNKLLVTPDANSAVNVAQMNGVTVTMGNGTAGTGVQRVAIASDNSAVAGFGVGATGSAPPANASYVAGIGGGATGGLLTGVPVCDQQAFLDMTTATTTELVALTASQTIHICHIRVSANGATTMTFKRGTGTNCGTGTTAIDNAIELTAQTGYVAGIGFGEVLNGGASANAVCVTNSAAVNLHIFVRYAKY